MINRILDLMFDFALFLWGVAADIIVNTDLRLAIIIRILTYVLRKVYEHLRKAREEALDDGECVFDNEEQTAKVDAQIL